MWIGKHPKLLQVINSARLIANTDVTTLILGESGTGKELMAHSIHQASPRSQQPFVAVNCATLQDSLAESLLFGHRKGVFTGAEQSHLGYIRAAENGTLFLDEVAELSLAVQAKLLRFIESAEIIPLGETTPIKVNVRIVAATHKNLSVEVEQGRFRQDLYYRLHIVPITLPALRERSSDITALIAHFIEQLAKQYDLAPCQIADSAQKVLNNYDWPGNIRELKNLCERLVITLPGKTIHPENLPAEINATKLDQSNFELPDTGIVLADLEKDLIEQALNKTQGNQSMAARLLGLTRDTLLYRMKKFALR